MNTLLWQPTPEQIQAANLTRFRQYLGEQYALNLDNQYSSLHQWSVHEPGLFWTAIWKWCGVLGDLGVAEHDPRLAYQPADHMIHTRWFPGASLNFAENLLRPDDADDTLAVITANEHGQTQHLTRRELLNHVKAFATYLRGQGIQPGDRVAAVVPNAQAALIAMLGTTAIGAIWSSCSPDFGQDAILERFRQIEPTVLISISKAVYSGKTTEVLPRMMEVAAQLPSVRSKILIPSSDEATPNGWTHWDDTLQATPETFHFVRFPFAHPIYILYSSGTTGAPKCIVHGAGGTLLQHLKEHQLHTDLRSGDRLFYFTTTGWMMWNWLVSGLASGATIMLYDGSPLHPDMGVLWRIVESHQVTQFGASARYLAHLQKHHYEVGQLHELQHCRTLLSTGSPLLPETYDWIYQAVKTDICLSSISGGTDIISCFALGSPTEPVRRGELQVKGLGMDVQVWNDDGQAIISQPGELVCVTPFPSMPTGFWNDPGNARYLDSYFSTFPNVWRHGDWAEETPEGGLIVQGRSDTTLNPGGVRIGTAEIYQQVEAFPSILEALATAYPHNGDEVIVLFVRLREGHAVDNALKSLIRQRIRERCSPRHAPRVIVPVPDFPRTISGKLSEIAVRETLSNRPVRNLKALANPESLQHFVHARSAIQNELQGDS